MKNKGFLDMEIFLALLLNALYIVTILEPKTNASFKIIFAFTILFTNAVIFKHYQDIVRSKDLKILELVGKIDDDELSNTEKIDLFL